ncbi:hypothetical protein BRADI_1g51583v3 [Brachypodium distachyon]|uniref:KIB1-4 beta-propeller domain-containing protein n=1 Tax=Brachypodium distachyon TaxID=15368 RepID=A0A0Q3HAJ8_BRADI|nr:hypothetical protein BRADI_1g51583v3 [Brachypodium distachyon]
MAAVATTTASLSAMLPPCLVIASGEGRQAATIVYNVSDGTRRPCEKIMSDNLGLGDGGKQKRSWVTSQGWVLVWDSTTLATFLWNPQNNNNISLPPLSRPPPARCPDTAFWYCHCSGAGASPSSEWARHEYDLGGSWVPGPDPTGHKVWYKRSMPPHLVPSNNGNKFYCPLSPAKYAVLDFSPSPSVTYKTLKPRPAAAIAVPVPGQSYSLEHVYALDIAGDPHTVWVSVDGVDAEAVLDVAVYRLDFAAGRQRSVRVDGIGDRAILAGGAFAGWSPATEHGLLPNSLYWVHPYDNRLYVYDVGANTEEQVLEPCKGVAAPRRRAG